jgi:response regulator NasT
MKILLFLVLVNHSKFFRIKYLKVAFATFFIKTFRIIMNTALKIILVDENAGRSAILRRALQDEGHEVICRMEEGSLLSNSNEITHADVIIVNADIADETIFANLSEVNKTKPKPIVMFAQTSSSEMAGTAIKAGVNAYIVDGLEEKRVQPIIDVAIARFREFQALKDELDSTRNQLFERKIVEKAKGLLMDKKAISEDEAYKTLRKMAMDKNIKIVDVAVNLISIFDIL